MYIIIMQRGTLLVNPNDTAVHSHTDVSYFFMSVHTYLIS
jgi:hypothetical protein